MVQYTVTPISTLIAILCVLATVSSATSPLPMDTQTNFDFLELDCRKNPNPTAYVKCLMKFPELEDLQSAGPHEYFDIKARDGTLLHTKVYFDSESPSKRPVVIDRTPYNCEGLDGDAAVVVKNGFHFAGQDFRGRFGSTGNFTLWQHASEDAFDTMKFLLQQEWCNGHLFAVGSSADGIAAYMMAQQSPPLLGQFVVVGSPNIHESVYQQGTFRRSLTHGWLNKIGEPGSIPVIRAQEGYDAFWADQDITGDWEKINWPAVHFGGWYDVFQFSTIEAFNGYQKHGGPLGRGLSFLFIDPLGHCSGCQLPFPNARDYSKVVLALVTQMFKKASQGMTALETLNAIPTLHQRRRVLEVAVEGARREVSEKYGFPEINKLNLYIMGPNDASSRGNYWASFPDWPTATPLTGYLLPNRGVSWTTPPGGSNATLSYFYNPANPVSTHGGNNLLLACGAWDQRMNEGGRNDILNFTSAPAQSDFAFIGPVSVRLFVSSSATDTDFTAKWLDVYPDGRRMLLQDGAVRMRWRQVSTPPSSTPSCITPGAIYEISVDLQYTAFILNKGHRIGVSISSSNYPRFSANPNTCQPLDSKQPVVARNTIYMSERYPSSIILPLVTLPPAKAFN